MFNTAGKQSVTLDNFGGLITEAPPESLPEGASPLTYDCDFPIAAVTTRPGLQPVLNSGAARNFVWVKTMRTLDGTLRTLCLDASGQLWLENATANPGVLTAITTFTPGDAASSANAFNREYICLSDPAGLVPDTPWQFDGTTFNRISQEGPGANATYSVPQAATQSAAITSFAITANVVIFQAVNGFSAGAIVSISGMLVGTYLNGAVLTVIATGLSGTQFEANFTHANVASTTDSGTASPIISFTIASITQPASVLVTVSDPTGIGIGWTNGPNSSASGNVITVFYSTSTADSALTQAFQTGIPVYVYMNFAGIGAPWPTGTYQVTSIGFSPCPGSHGGNNTPFYFFTITAPNIAAIKQHTGTFTYQMSLATVIASSPVAGLVQGDQVSIQGATPTPWNNTWSVVTTANSGVLNITQTSASGGVATYTFTLVSGNNPVVGDLVTVTNTTNGNGAFNVVNAVIASVVGSTFTIAFSVTSVGSQAETGSAQTFGKVFTIDPGALYVGLTNANNPIFGNDSGTGTVVALGSTLTIGAGTRQAVVIFLFSDGSLSRPSPPVTFTTNGLQQSITATNIPIGPANTVARWVAFTEAGANGIPGAFFYVIPLPVQSIVNGQPFTYSSTVVNDNLTTTATFAFTDAVLLNATEVDVPGADVFALRTLGNCRWTVPYANRMFYGLEQSKIDNFLNLSFNGGYQGGTLFPAGWTADPTNGGGVSLITGASFGFALQIKNTTGSTQVTYGMVTQPAFQDAYNAPIIQQNTAYNIRIVAAKGLNSDSGNIVVDLVSFDTKTGYGTVYGNFTLPLSSITITASQYTGTLLITKFTTVPANLVLRVYTTNMTNNSTAIVGGKGKGIEIYDVSQPVLSTQVAASYAGRGAMIDAVTGVVGLAQRNLQAANGAFVMYDQLYFLKDASMFVTRDSVGDEPSLWDVHEVSNRVGTVSIWSYDVGEEWMATASREGVFVFTGGSPVKVSQEIQQVWELINWNARYAIWLRNDILNRRILIGVPMPTPNAYLPNAPPVTNPTTPNVIIALNYVGLNGPQDLAMGPQMHVTMFGTLVSADMRRKWNIWQIPCPYADFIARSDGISRPLFLCNGINSGKIYQLNATQFSDDGVAINGRYVTYGFTNSGMAKQNPLLGFHRKLYTYLQMMAYGAGTLIVKFLANTLNADARHQWSVLSAPDGSGQVGIPLQANPVDDIERSINIAGNRVFVDVSTNAVGAHFTLSKAILVGGPHPMVPLRGSASA